MKSTSKFASYKRIILAYDVNKNDLILYYWDDDEAVFDLNSLIKNTFFFQPSFVDSLPECYIKYSKENIMNIKRKMFLKYFEKYDNFKIKEVDKKGNPFIYSVVLSNENNVEKILNMLKQNSIEKFYSLNIYKKYENSNLKDEILRIQKQFDELDIFVDVNSNIHNLNFIKEGENYLVFNILGTHVNLFEFFKSKNPLISIMIPRETEKHIVLCEKTGRIENILVKLLNQHNIKIIKNHSCFLVLDLSEEVKNKYAVYRNLAHYSTDEEFVKPLEKAKKKQPNEKIITTEKMNKNEYDSSAKKSRSSYEEHKQSTQAESDEEEYLG